MIHDMHSAVVQKSGESGGGSTGHSTLLEKLYAHVATGRVNALDEVRHPVVKEGVSEVSIFLAEGADTGGFKARNLQMPDMAWWTTDPLEAVFNAGKPVVEHGLEAGVVSGEGSRTPTMGRHE